MKKNGFTLIELLAVIVILAIIALIATPIILGIINDAREKANERSVELYASAVRNGIAAYQLRTGNEVLPDTYDESNPLPFEVEYDGKVDCISVIIGEDGKVSLDKCTVNGGEKQYNYGIEEETPSTPVEKVCTITKQDESKYSVGDIVTCELSESTDKFYVIEDAELTTGTIQMLTEKNIHTTTYRQDDDDVYTAFSTTNYWSSETTYPLDVYDERNDIIKPIVDNYVSYLNAKITSATGSLLTYEQATELLGKDEDSTSCSNYSTVPWAYSTWYWLGSAQSTTDLFIVTSACAINLDVYNDAYTFGVRPVITISTANIK